MPLWYILDEFGSSIQHSDEPTFAMKPFYFANRQLAYNILWPLKDIVFGGLLLCVCPSGHVTMCVRVDMSQCVSEWTCHNVCMNGVNMLLCNVYHISTVIYFNRHTYYKACLT